jgi:hypothetical protein
MRGQDIAEAAGRERAEAEIGQRLAALEAIRGQMGEGIRRELHQQDIQAGEDHADAQIEDDGPENPVVRRAAAAEDGGRDDPYGKPPVATRFKPGTSGNPKGRKPAPPSLSEILMEELAALVPMKQGDKITKLPMQRIVIRKHLQLAAQGNGMSARLVITLIQILGLKPEIPEIEALTAEELAILQKDAEFQKLLGGGE